MSLPRLSFAMMCNASAPDMPAPDMPATDMSVTIVGFGAFGAFIASHLAPFARINVLEPSPLPRVLVAQMGLDLLSGPEAIGESQIIILAVPVHAIAPVLRQIAPHLRAHQIVLDVCSVKEGPARLMADLLPPDVQILATHPMFGPQSAKAGLAGLQMVLCPVRGQAWRRIGAFLRAVLGLRVIITSVEEHDRQAALSQGVTHLLAHALAQLGDRPRIRTRSFDLMVQAFAMVLEDAPEVYEAITQQNRHVAPLRLRLIEGLARAGVAGADTALNPARVA